LGRVTQNGPTGNSDMYLDGELESVDRVFGSDGVGAAEMQDDLGDAVMIRQRATTDVDIVGGSVVKRQSHVMSRVQQRPTHLVTVSQRS